MLFLLDVRTLAEDVSDDEAIRPSAMIGRELATAGGAFGLRGIAG
jgi:hypothetical protein